MAQQKGKTETPPIPNEVISLGGNTYTINTTVYKINVRIDGTASLQITSELSDSSEVSTIQQYIYNQATTV